MPLLPPAPFPAPASEGKFRRVHALVRRVPEGRVTTYGRVARAVTAAGYPLSARAAGWALRNSPEGVPWHRVVNAEGALSAELSGNCEPGRQRALLAREGVPFDERGRVRLARCLFEPADADAFFFPDGELPGVTPDLSPSWSRLWSRFRPNWVDGAGILCAALYLGLALPARGPGDPGVASFLLISAAIAALTFGLYRWAGRAPGRISVGRLLAWAVVFRAIGLFGGPFFEDDFFRYLWDGYRFAQDGTPYGLAPEAFFGDAAVPALFQGVLDQINFPELPTIYGPVTQFAFLLGYGVAPGSVAALQLIFILFDLLTIGLLLRLAPTRAVLLYAWCPLVVKEVAFTAHPDGFAVFFVLAAVLLAQRERLHAAAALLAFGTGAKVLALAVAPFVLRPVRLAHWVTFGGVLALLYLPFAWQGGTDLSTLFVFAREWEFNASVFALLTPLLPNAAARAVCGALFLAGAAWLYFREPGAGRDAPPGDRLYGLLLLVAPVVNPWYLLWVLPFAAIRPSIWAWAASVAVLLSYVTGLNLQDMNLHPFGHPPWVPVLEYGMVAVAVVMGIVCRRRRIKAAGEGTVCTEG